MDIFTKTSQRLFLIVGLMVAISLSSCDERKASVRLSSNEQPTESLDECMEFMFQVLNRKTQRQGGQKVNLFVKYKYDSHNEKLYPDYRKVRTTCIKYIQPSEKLPKDEQWEIITRKMAREVMDKYPVKAISIQWQTFPNEKPEGDALYEPGFHGSIYTIGDITPLAIPGSHKNVPNMTE
ncbi:hypothetical protein FUAX_36740 [Fulvitalea axinellae]|uniref:Lipoprotein n=1 Tax=Fulvitalea axinellae TaxID=1182444 RepID=A0AAU9D0N4_9BACT|nr:hypothetical protein FUAX_36740 [Fulvitalea axinellae]